MKNKKIFNPFYNWKTLNPKTQKTVFLMLLMLFEVVSGCFAQSTTADAFTKCICNNLRFLYINLYAGNLYCRPYCNWRTNDYK